MAEMPIDLADEVLAGGSPATARDERLDEGAAALAGGARRSVLLNERFLIGVAGSLMSVGVVAILLGWYGASRTVLVSEQVPYLISGGLLGVALATIGALTFFTHWVAVLVRDNRRQHQDLVRVIQDESARDRAALLEALRALRDEGARPAARTAPRPARRVPRSS